MYHFCGVTYFTGSENLVNFNTLNSRSVFVFHFSGHTALHEASAYKRRSVCCMLVAAGASLNILNWEGRTARELAKLANDHELADYLESK